MSRDLNDDFEGEFPPIKQLSEREAQNLRFIKRLKIHKKITELENSSAKEYEKSNYDQTNSNSKLIEVKSNVIKATRSVLNDVVDNLEVNKSFRLRDGLNNLFFSDSGLIDTSQPDKIESQPSAPEVELGTSAPYSHSSSINAEEEDKKDGSMDWNMNITVSKEKLKNIRLAENGENLLLGDGFVLSDANPDKDLDIPVENVSEKDIKAVRDRVLSQLLGRTENFFNLLQSPELAEKYKEIYKTLENTVRDNEGHSLLIFGGRSSGKTAMLELALKNLSTLYKDHFVTIKINASIHSDDVTAIRDIARQLDSHAKELSGNLDADQPTVEQRSISDTFSNILTVLDKNSSNANNENDQSIPIIFIIDEFDKFTNGHRQTLLYNLLDLSQNSTVPISVVGTSTKITTRELLEKRVRSRFSQRVIVLSKPKSLPDFWINAKLGLLLNDDFGSTLENKDFQNKWNSKIEDLFEESSPNFMKLIYSVYYSTKNYKDFNNNCVFPISNINITNPFPKDEDFSFYSSSQSSNNIQSIFSSLSHLELLLLICAIRWVEKFDDHLINFNLAYKEYEEAVKQLNTYNTAVHSRTASSKIDPSILSHIKVQHRIWSPKTLKNCWQNLYRMGLLLDYGAVTTNADGNIISTSNSNKNIILEDNKMVQLDVTLDEMHRLIDDSNIFKKLTRL